MFCCLPDCMCNRSREGKKLLRLCLPPGQKMSRKVPKAHLLITVLKIGWETIMRGDWGASRDDRCPLEQPWASLVPCLHRSIGLGPLRAPDGRRRSSIWGLRVPLPNAEPGLGANTNPAVFLKWCGVLSQSNKTRKHVPFTLPRAFI